MEVPAAARAVAGIVGGEPFLDVDAEFATEAQAVHWETEWPGIQHAAARQPAADPGRVLVAARARHAGPRGRAVRIHLTATHDETLRLMGVALRFLGG